LDLFVLIYAALVSALIAWAAAYLESGLRRLLFGLSAGLIAAAALPFVQAWLGY